MSYLFNVSRTGDKARSWFSKLMNICFEGLVLNMTFCAHGIFNNHNKDYSFITKDALL